MSPCSGQCTFYFRIYCLANTSCLVLPVLLPAVNLITTDNLCYGAILWILESLMLQAHRTAPWHAHPSACQRRRRLQVVGTTPQERTAKRLAHAQKNRAPICKYVCMVVCTHRERCMHIQVQVYVHVHMYAHMHACMHCARVETRRACSSRAACRSWRRAR